MTETSARKFYVGELGITPNGGTPASDNCVAGNNREMPYLTDAEREAIEIAMHRCDTQHYKTLRSLLERLK